MLTETTEYNYERSGVFNPSVKITVTLYNSVKKKTWTIEEKSKIFWLLFPSIYNLVQFNVNSKELTKMMSHLIAKFAHMCIITFVSPES